MLKFITGAAGAAAADFKVAALTGSVAADGICV